GVGGTGSIFLLLDRPEVYGLPSEPVTPTRRLAEGWGAAAIAAGALGFGGGAAVLGGGPARGKRGPKVDTRPSHRSPKGPSATLRPLSVRTMPEFEPAYLRDLGRRIFEAAGAPTDIAEHVADHLVASNLAGHDSHGVIRISWYVEEVRAG